MMTMTEATSHYNEIENRTPDRPGGAITAANEDIDRAILFLVGLGVDPNELAGSLVGRVSRLVEPEHSSTTEEVGR